MEFWESGVARDGLFLLSLLYAASVLRRRVKLIARLTIPVSLLAGTAGLLLGPGLLDLLPFDKLSFKSVVYHGLAVIFIAVALQRPAQGSSAKGARSVALALPALLALQALAGLAVMLLLFAVTGAPLHPGTGLLLPLGFGQGPGQALSIGKVWESSGLADGSQIGLIIASLGFAWSVLVGVPLVHWGRRKGLCVLQPHDKTSGEVATNTEPAEPGGLSSLARQAALIGFVYLLTLGAIRGLDAILPWRKLAGYLWGFHFVMGAGLALVMRRFLRPDAGASRSLQKLSGLSVDVVTCAALCAVEPSVLSQHWLVLLLVTSLGGLATLALCLWIGRHAFAEHGFSHAVFLFGMGTGTLPTGLALLRILDPELKSPVARNGVVGSAASVPLCVPLVVGLIPFPVATWPEGYPSTSFLILGALAAYLLVFLLLLKRNGSKLAPGKHGSRDHGGALAESP